MEETLEQAIDRLCDEGEAFFAQDDYLKALDIYKNAWELLPDRKEDHDMSTWITAAIGEAYFLLQDFKNSAEWFRRGMLCSDGFANPFILLKYGVSEYELGDMHTANEYLLRAYMLEGEAIFANEDGKFFDLVKKMNKL